MFQIHKGSELISYEFIFSGDTYANLLKTVAGIDEYFISYILGVITINILLKEGCVVRLTDDEKEKGYLGTDHYYHLDYNGIDPPNNVMNVIRLDLDTMLYNYVLFRNTFQDTRCTENIVYEDVILDYEYEVCVDEIFNIRIKALKVK